METALEILDSQAHRHLRVRPRPTQVSNFVQIVPGEFAAAAAICPILFAKNPETGRFYAGAMFGFKEGENLLADSESGLAGFRPLEQQREAFFISGENIAIDRASPRISELSGEPLFDEDGGPTPPTRQIQRILGQLKAGLDDWDRFVAAMTRLGLIEPVDISMRFDDGETINLVGLYTVSIDRLHALDDAAVLKLFRDGDLHLAYSVAGSLKQVPILAERRNRQLAKAA
jgi:hypothetical protein